MKKKQVRGFRRHLRRHQAASAISENLDMARIEQLHYDYKKIGLAPWTVSEKPPLAIRKLWVNRLVADFYRWREQLKHHYPNCYLAVWIFEPDFGESQVVAAIEERKIQYEESFGDVMDVRLPPEYQFVAGTSNLQWTARANIIPYLPEDFKELGSWASRKPHWTIETSDGQVYVAVQVGWVWIGQEAPRDAS